jgi:hypothetical protein
MICPDGNIIGALGSLPWMTTVCHPGNTSMKPAELADVRCDSGNVILLVP